MNTEANECLATLSLTVFRQSKFVADFLQARCDLDVTRSFCVFSSLCWASELRTMIILNSLESAYSGLPINVN